ncbi:MAG: TonB-dependent receptor [Pseudomonadota bacterium]
MKTHRLAALAMSTILAAQPVLSQDSLDLGTLILSGGLTPIEEQRYGRSATVVTADEIETSGAQYITDVLRRVPGVAVSRSGSFGGFTQVRIRGNEGNHTLVLIDGVEAATTGNEFDFGGLLAADIERIEVLRGPQSSLYGSNAIGGVISITTKRATEPGVSGRFSSEVGTDGTVASSVALGAKGARGDINLSFTRNKTDGFDISGTNGEDDGDLNLTYNLNGRYALTDTITIGGTLRHVNRDSDVDGSNITLGSPAAVNDDASFNKEKETFVSVFAEVSTFGGRLQNRIDYSYYEQTARSFTVAFAPFPGGGNFNTKEERNKFAYRGTLALDSSDVDTANHLLTGAFEYEDESFQVTSGTLNRSREQLSYILEYQGSITPSFDVQASVRFDDNDAFDDFFTYALGMSYTLPNQTTRFHGSYGTGVQNPSFFDQFGFAGTFVGNPNLQPEQSEGWDIGVEQQFWDGRGVIDVTYFRQDVKDFIGSALGVITPGLTSPINLVGTAERSGVEVAGTLELDNGLSFGLAYTYLDAKIAGGARVETRRPENELSLQIGYQLPNQKTRVNAELQYVDDLFDQDFSPAGGAALVQLQDYTLVNLGISHDVTDTVQVTAHIHNALDENYQEVSGFATQGRTAFVGVQAKF